MSLPNPVEPPVAGAPADAVPPPGALVVSGSRSGVAGALLRRVGFMLLVLFLVSVGVFGLVYAAPGSPEQSLTAGRPVTPQVLAEVRQRYHLDQPIPVQYVAWLGNAARLDFGRSYRSDQEVTSLIVDRGAISLELAGLAFVLVFLAALPLALLAAVRRRRLLDRLISAAAVTGVSAPPFAVAVLLLYVFGVTLGWFPIYGAGDGGLDRLYHLVLPAAALAAGLVALVLKITRAALVTVLEQEYVTFARARGLSRRRVLLTYGLRNSLGPVATAAGLTFGSLIASTALVEQAFAIPGLGTLLVTAVNNQDMPVIQGVSITIAALILVVMLLTDILYVVLDPRLQLREALA